MTDQPSLIEFPCNFPIKIMGKSQDGFADTVTAIVKLHSPNFDVSTIELRSSKGGKYLSVTCTIWVTSQKQLDAIYQALCDNPTVSIVL